MTRLVIDYPVKYTDMSYGDMTFVLAHLYEKNTEYKAKIDKAKLCGRPLMLDNGAWEFGSSMPVDRYLKIISELEPTCAVIPDVFKNRLQSEKMTKSFIESYDIDNTTALMFVPQGESLDEVVASYNAIATEYGEFFEILAIPKHIGENYNRVQFVDELYDHSVLKPHMVHFLGFWDWEELSYQKERPWELGSIDTKYPVKQAYWPETFTSQLDYYNTKKVLNDEAFSGEVNIFYMNLNNNGWEDYDQM